MLNEIDLILPQIFDGEDKNSAIKNCIRNNYKHLRKWAKRNLTNAFRLYDREIKEYTLTIDFYAGHYLVNYFSYERECAEPCQELQEEINQALCSLFGITQEKIYWKSRIRRKREEQYEKVASVGNFFTVLEYGTKFHVNLSDYLDTGLFLDHRETRRIVSSMACGAKVLNLFAYTCAFSVQAALKGAAYTKSLDLSNTYTEWGRKNFILNEIDLKNHEILRMDCLQYLKEAKETAFFDLIILDPPTLSRSKKMEQFFDIQMDYVDLINRSLRLLKPTGSLFFSTNSRTFKFDPSLIEASKVQEITKKSIPEDFHNQKIHRLWKIQL